MRPRNEFPTATPHVCGRIGKAVRWLACNYAMIKAVDRAAREPMSGIPAMELEGMLELRQID